VTTPITYLDSIILGVVEGLTEFLPVSSTGHLTVAEKLLGARVNDPAVTAFTAIIQFGAIVATFIYFRRDFGRLIGAGIGGLFDDRHRRGRDFRFAWYVAAGSMPVVVVGFLGKDVVKGPLRSLWVVAVSLILWSAVMYVSEGRSRQKYSEDDLTLKQVLLIGVFQCIALVPGVSRSGATISGGLLQDVDRVTATRLSFFLAIPALTGAGVFELKDVNTAVVGWGPLAVGTLVSFVIAYASIAWLLKYVARHPLTVFVGYRILAGLTIIGLLTAGVIPAT
jgi:undecaprenyl-diphosphatase